MEKNHSFLENFFFPTEDNSGVPLGLSSQAFAFWIILWIAIAASPLYFTSSPFASLLFQEPPSFTKEEVISLINKERIKANLRPLSSSEILNQAANSKAEDILEKEYFAHTSPSGKEPWEFFREKKYDFYAAGENLAIDFVKAADAHSALINSPSHRANILNPLYEEVGVAVRTGEFNGKISTVVVQLFGKPRKKAAIALNEAEKPAIGNVEKPIPNKAGGLPQTEPDNSVQNKIAPSVKGQKVQKEAINPKNSAVSIFQEKIVSAQLKPEATIAIMALMIFIIAPTAFLFTRNGSLKKGLVLRSILLIALFGYLAISGAKEIRTSALDNQAAAIIYSVGEQQILPEFTN